MKTKIKLLSLCVISSFSLFSQVKELNYDDIGNIKGLAPADSSFDHQNSLSGSDKKDDDVSKHTVQSLTKQNTNVSPLLETNEVKEHYTIMTYDAASGFYIMRFITKKVSFTLKMD